MTMRFLFEPGPEAPAIAYAARQLFLLAGWRCRAVPYPLAQRSGRGRSLPTMSYGGELPPVASQLHLWAGARGRRTGASCRGVDAVHRGVPVLVRGARRIDGHIRRERERLETDLDLVASALLLLTRSEEIGSCVRDRFGRVPTRASLACREGFLRRPLVNEYAQLLAEWIESVTGGLRPDLPHPPGFVFCVTHDVDQLTLFGSARDVASAARRIGQGPQRMRRLRRLAGDAAGVLTGRCRDPYDTFGDLMDWEEGCSIRSTVFAMAGGHGRFEGRYRLREAAPLLRELARRGHEVGVHGSFETWRDGALLRRERSALEDTVGVEIVGGRQHYLRFAVPETWRAAVDAGLQYDSTLGYPDEIGFRAAICAPFRPFDAVSGREFPVWEAPLAVMDVGLSSALALSCDEAESSIVDLAAQVAHHHGVLVLLWHNATLYDAVHPGWGKLLRRVVGRLRAMGGRPLRLVDAVEEWRLREQRMGTVAPPA